MSTHYTTGGMPLAFTQEDFLVICRGTLLNAFFIEISSLILSYDITSPKLTVNSEL